MPPAPGTEWGAWIGPARSNGGATLTSTASWLPWYPPLEFRDPGLSAEPSGQPNRVQGRFGAGVHEPDPVQGSDPPAHLRGHIGLDARGGAQGDALLQLGPNGFHDLGMVVPQDLGGVVVGEVQIAVPVDVFQDAPPGSRHGQGIGLKEIGALGRSGRQRRGPSKSIG